MHSPKFTSRKIWVIEKFWNFPHCVLINCTLWKHWEAAKYPPRFSVNLVEAMTYDLLKTFLMNIVNIFHKSIRCFIQILDFFSQLYMPVRYAQFVCFGLLVNRVTRSSQISYLQLFLYRIEINYAFFQFQMQVCVANSF